MLNFTFAIRILLEADLLFVGHVSAIHMQAPDIYMENIADEDLNSSML